MKKFLFIFMLLIWFTGLDAQNLVPNPSFETYTICPYDGSQLQFATPWVPAAATDFWSSEAYHACQGDGITDPDCSVCVPDNWMGHQYAHTGEGYAGIWAYFPLGTGSETVNETVSAELIEPMEEGVEYSVSFWVNLGDESQFAIDQLYVHFSAFPVSVYTEINLEPHIVSPEDVFMTSKTEWVEITGEYIAEGGEQYITIGNFEHMTETNWTNANGGLFAGAYYYVDDVSVLAPPPTEVVGETTICAGDSTTLTVYNADEWAWSTVFDPEIIFSTDSVITVSPAQTTLYFMDDGDEVFSILVNVNPLPEVDLGEDQSLCEGMDWLINPNLVSGDFTWQDGSTENTFLVQESGIYWLEYNNGICSNLDSVEFVYHDAIEFSLGSDTMICNETGIVLMVPEEYYDFNLEWNDGSSSLDFQVLYPGIYSLEINDSICYGEDEIEIEFINCQPTLIMPNIFTPNTDEFNPFFRPIEVSNLAQINTKIYNRWGTLLFESDVFEILWDGKFDGAGVAPGVYYYIVDYQDLFGDSVTISGDFTLIR